LIFFHFAGLKELRPYLFMVGLSGYYIRPTVAMKRFIIAPYLKALIIHAPGRIGERIRKTDNYMCTFNKIFRTTLRVMRSIVFGDYCLYYKGRIW